MKEEVVVRDLRHTGVFYLDRVVRCNQHTDGS